MIKIKIEKNTVDLYQDDEDSPIYSIRKDELALVRKEDGHIISDWIDHLMSKTWMENTTLYKLAALIQKEFPENSIDWSVTFFPVEKRQYLDHVKNTRYLSTEKQHSDEGIADLFESIEIGVEENNHFVNSKVSEIVEINLQHHGIK